MSLLGFLITLLSACMTVLANVLLQKGLAQGTAGLTSLQRLISLLGSPQFLIGLACYAGAMLPWLYVLSREQLSIAYPVLVGVTFTLMIVSATFFQGEGLNATKLAGAALIVFGITLVSNA